MARKQLTIAVALVAVAAAGNTRVEAGDLLGTLGVGHCSTCQKSYAPVPAYVPMPVYQAYAYGPPTAMVRQVPGRPPEPAPKWARPRGTVPVIALPEPAPKWADVDPSALAVNRQAIPAPAAIPYPTTVQPFANGQLRVQTPVAPYGAGFVPVQQKQPVAAQPLPNAVAAQPGAVGVPPVNPATVNRAIPAPGPAIAQPRIAAPRFGAPGVPQLPAGTVVSTPLGPQAVAVPVAPRAVATMPRPARVQYFNDDWRTPPPGTLGRTYMRPTRIVPWDTHPRVGGLDVEILDTLRQGLARDVKIKIHAEDMYGNFKPLEGFRGDDGVWHFESDPLLPTVPHIYNVHVELIRERQVTEIRYGRQFLRNVEDNLGTLAVRRVRLIPGRIVDLVVY